jgi:hypothetical protein
MLDFGMHDLDGNGMPDIAGVSTQSSAVSLIKNRGDVDNVIFCESY